jgi:hypothetical protein
VVDEAYTNAQNNIQTKVVFKHLVRDIDLPTRRVSRDEYETALKMVNEIRSREPGDSQSPDTVWNRFLSELNENENTKECGAWDSDSSVFVWL